MMPIKKITWMVLLGLLLLFGLWATTLHSYLLFHGLAEIFSIVVAFSIFILAWNSCHFVENSYLLFIGIAYLFVGGLDLTHTLAYKGMGIFSGDEANLATQLWITARYIESISLLIASFIVGRKLKTSFVFIGYILITTALLGSIFYWNLFPVCFVEGEGLTIFKKASEYIISFILIASVISMLRKQNEVEQSVLRLLITSIVVTVASELTFTLYTDVYGFSNFLGHYLKIISFYLIYLAVIKTGLTKPYALFAQDIKQSKEELLIKDEAIASSIVAIGITDLDGKIVYVNNSLVKMWGYDSDEEILGRFLPEFWEGDGVFKTIKILREKGTRIGEDIGKRKDGSLFHILFSGSMIKDKTGSPLFMFGSFLDITLRKEAEEALAASEEKYRGIFDDSVATIYVFDEKKCFINSNQAGLDLLGYSRDELLSMSIPDVDADPAVVLPEHKQLLSGENIVDYEHQLRRKDGMIVTVLNNSKPLSDADGKIIGMQSTLIDITDRKQTEEELRKSEEKFRSLMEQSPLSIAIFTPEGQITQINNAWLQLWGVNEEEAAQIISNYNLLTDKQIVDLGFASLVRKAFDGEQVVLPPIEYSAQRTVEELGLEDLKANSVWIQSNWSPVKNENQEIEFVVNTNVDFTKHKQAEEAIQKSQDSMRFLAGKLITAQEEERRLLAREMHDDFTQRLAILAIEAGKLEIESQQDDSPMHAKLQEMKKKIIKLSKDIHDISRQIHPAILDDLGLLDAIKSECEIFTQREEIHVEYEAKNVPRSIPRNVAICIYRIAQESLRNIAKYAKVDKAFVSLIGCDGNLILTVRDYGIGFNTEQTLSHKGIGITSMQERVRLIEGEFSLQSKPGEGTVIKVKAPYKEEKK